MPRGPLPRAGLDHLRAWRLWRGYSQEELAERSGISRPTLSKLESGKASANFVTVRKLADGLGITREQLLHEQPQ